MDTREQLERLLGLVQVTRRSAAEIGTIQTEVANQLDTAEYDLRRLMRDLQTILPQRPAEADLRPERQAAPQAMRRSA
jgi:hypothetical protein